MGITRAQIARQLLAEGGMPMKKIKGQDHMLAYITPNEANKLVRLGGQETMTPEGIPAYPEYDNYGYSSQQDFCLLYTSPSPRDGLLSRMPSSA